MEKNHRLNYNFTGAVRDLAHYRIAAGCLTRTRG